MIRLIEGSVASFYPREIAAMHRNRYDVFVRKLKWVEPDLTLSRQGMEIDTFDLSNPLYLISLDPETDEYQGSLRLLPTTGPNMLADVPVFRDLIDSPIESVTIWESSRFVTADDAPKMTTAELVIGIGEIVVSAGLTGIVSVFDARMFRLLTIIGCRMEELGSGMVGGVSCVVAVFDPHPDHLAALKRRAGITGSVLEPDHAKTVARLPYIGA